jgi:peroxiredoxin
MNNKSSIKILLALLIVFLPLVSKSQQWQQNNIAIEQMTKQIDNYIGNTPHITDSLVAACDRLISNAQNQKAASFVAGYLFNKFSTSSIIGDESVAVYISRKYFLDGPLEWSGDGGIALLRLYTEFNENSLIGMDAPELALSSIGGNSVNIHELSSRFTILYFFDSSCKTCKDSFPELAGIIERFNHLSISVYAVYTQSDTNQLEVFRQTFKQEIENSKAEWFWVYDQDGQSNFHKLYNVLSTPQMFLLDREKRIIGRNLNPNSLESILGSREKMISELHSTAQSFVPQYLSLFDLKKEPEWDAALEPLFQKVSKDNLEMFNALFYHLFLFLSNSDQQYEKDCAVYLAQKYICGKPDLWYDNYLVNQIISLEVNKIKQNAPGSLFPDFTFYSKRGKHKKIKFKNNNYTYIYFFNPDCAICKPFTYELKKVHRQLKKKGVKVIGIFTGDNQQILKNYLKQQPVPWLVVYPGKGNQQALFNTYEIKYLPQTYLIDSGKKIIVKAANTIKIKEHIK